MKTAPARTAAALALATGLLVGGFGATVPALAAPAVAPVHAEAPDVGALQNKLQLVLDTSAAPAARANELEAGEAGLPLVDKVGGVMASVPGFQWHATEPVTVDGDHLTHNLQITVPNFDPMTIELSWVDLDGNWKLTRESECTIAYYANQPCTV